MSCKPSKFILTIRKELLLCYRNRKESLNGLLFFSIIVILFPLTLNLDETHLKLLVPGVIWIAALLSTLLSLPQLFQPDFEDGTLAQIILSPMPLTVAILAKVISHWLMHGLPLILIAPVLALMFHLDSFSILVLITTLLLGTPLLHLLGGFVAALTVGLRQGGVLISLVLMPFYIPPLIFACGAVVAALQQTSVVVPLLLLASLSILALSLIPVLISFALRISINYDQ